MDNASTHLSMEDFDRIWNKRSDETHEIYSPDHRFHIGLYLQPANSPDLNVLGLGVFNALQNLQWKVSMQNITKMVPRVMTVFQRWPRYKLNNVFLTLQHCMNEIISCNGDNNYCLIQRTD